MIDEITPRFFITGITKENEQSIVDKLECSGFSNWWSLPEDTADYIFVSQTLGNKYMRMWEPISDLFNTPMITAEKYLSEEVSK
ncbi:hypothetical protein LM1A4_042 [Leuconostoc phage 1-A4]|uniref:Uncharacterized protein n=1 Tax=Leuconostoc phage 1-A4 TaxID=745088 RepID=D4N4L5_9CAUD|nr:hypothetical protein LM1A4_042 [Leuconostoc phage 1-A4]ADD71765.1 hypothetical protein LM1A4_042 [Leuconostoc phage 1-A4]